MSKKFSEWNIRRWNKTRQFGDCNVAWTWSFNSWWVRFNFLESRKIIFITFRLTVGIDFVLRRKIWNYLKVYQVKNESTIIFTSHCVGELEIANTIAFIRNGEILCENSPKMLLQQLQVNSLDDVFLELSRRHEGSKEE